jgi:hypothetical protein
MVEILPPQSGAISVPTKREEKKIDIKALRAPKIKQNVIPTPEVLEVLIAKALHAMRHGVFWDRGSIINIVL